MESSPDSMAAGSCRVIVAIPSRRVACNVSPGTGSPVSNTEALHSNRTRKRPARVRVENFLRLGFSDAFGGLIDEESRIKIRRRGTNDPIDAGGRQFPSILPTKHPDDRPLWAL